MKVKLLTALAGIDFNYQCGDIVDTPEGASWIASGIAEAIKEVRKIETASAPISKETAAVKRKVVPSAEKVISTLKDSEA